MACGLDVGYINYKYLYFWLPLPNYLNKTTCVKECPTFEGTEE
jgi:hypothetical protein